MYKKFKSLIITVVDQLIPKLDTKQGERFRQQMLDLQQE